jgi:hypothetical protein
VPLSRLRTRHLCAALALLGARLVLWLAPASTVRWASRRHLALPFSLRIPDIRDSIARAVVSVSVRGPLPFSCLEQSLALVSLLAIRGTPARLVIGVSRTPFVAHAWVECDGRILLGESETHGVTPLTGTTLTPRHG